IFHQTRPRGHLLLHDHHSRPIARTLFLLHRTNTATIKRLPTANTSTNHRHRSIHKLRRITRHLVHIQPELAEATTSVIHMLNQDRIAIMTKIPIQTLHVDKLLQNLRLSTKQTVALMPTRGRQTHIEHHSVPLSTRCSPHLQLATKLQMPLVNKRFPVRSLRRIILSRRRVNPEPHDLVGFQALLYPVIYLIAVNKKPFTTRAARTRPHAKRLTKTINNTTTNKRRSILRLRTVQEHRNTIPRLKHLRLVSQRREISRLNKRILSHRKTIKVKADSVSRSQ